MRSRLLSVLLAALTLGALFALGSERRAVVALGADAAVAQPARPTVDPELRARLAASRSGRVPAVVTAWNRAGLRSIERLGVQGARLKVLPMILTSSLTRAQLRALERSPAVRSVYANHRYRIVMEDTTWITKARYAWEPPSAGGLGVTGKDVHLAVIDTGADGLHEDMDNLVEFCETQQALSGTRATVLCSPSNPAAGNAGPAGATGTARGDATDDDGHGSHVSGTIAGSGQASGGRSAAHSTTGMAPDAKLHVYSANVGPTLQNHEILASYDDLIFKKVNGISRVVAVNNSWGGGGGGNYNPDDPQQIAVKAAYDAGILSVFAAGNSGPEHNTLSRQCVSPWVVCVAATTKPDAVVMFSSRGRPSEPADTNRDGVVGGTGDVAPANHDRALGQAYELGLYRPTLAAPGVNINSISANAATCREGGATPDSGCYELLNGTSMATPHVTGAVGLIVEGYRQGHGGATPTPAIITDILERSARKLPGYEAEEQGAGRLDVVQAVLLARSYPNGLPRPSFGTPSPPYAAGKHPGAPGAQYVEKGCTGTLSWTLPGVPNPLDVDSPPVATERYGEHLIDVPAKTERLRITVDWSRHPGANLYLRLWRPGVDPDQDTASAGQVRVWPDQEAVGLLNPNNTPFIGPTRWLDVRAPEEGGLQEGTWTLRVYHRVGGSPSACDADSRERPKQVEGFNYTVKVELPQTAEAPTVAVTAPAEGATVGGRFVDVSGTASYPAPWNGVTTWEVAGTGTPALGPEGPDTRTVLHFQGNLEEGCTGVGAADVAVCMGPFLRPSGALSAFPAASWTVANPLLNGTTARNAHDPNWTWALTAPTTVSGAMTVEFWASCGGCARSLGLNADWFVRLWADGAKVFEQRVTATPASPNVAEKLSVTVNVPTFTAQSQIVLHVDPVYVDSQNGTKIYYDSTQACPTASGTGPCDSLVRMPVGSGGSSAGPATPSQVRVTDRHDALVVAWSPVAGATGYEIHRSTNPAFVPGPASRIATTEGTSCQSPDVPSWPGASRSGLCYVDGAVAAHTTVYYRVVAVQGEAKSKASLLAYGAATPYDRQVKVKVDRLYGPQYWEYATLRSAAGTEWSYTWDTLELALGERRLGARSFTQGVGSAKAGVTVRKDEDGDEGGEVAICHATGSSSSPYVRVVITKRGVVLGHLGDRHRDGKDIVPPFEYRGTTYSQNWPQGQAIWANGCRTG